MRDKETVVLEAVRQNGFAIEYASDRLGNIILEVIKSSCISSYDLQTTPLEYVDLHLFSDEELILKCCEINELCYVL